MASLFEMLKKNQEKLEASTGRNARTVSLKDGKSIWRILPSPKKGDDMGFARDFAQHYVKVPGAAKSSVFVCQHGTYEQECPMCDWISQAILMAKNDEQRNALSRMRAAGRVLVNAVEIKGKEHGEPVILSLPKGVYAKAFSAAMEAWGEMMESEEGVYSEDTNPLTDLNQGLSIIFNKSGSGLDTEYSVMISMKKFGKIDKSVMSKVTHLDDFIATENKGGELKMGTVLKALPGIPPMLSDDSDDKPFKSKKSAHAGKFSDGDEDMFDDTDEDEEEDDVPDFPPPKKTAKAKPAVKPKAKAKPVEEDDEDDLDALLSEVDDEDED